VKFQEKGSVTEAREENARKRGGNGSGKGIGEKRIHQEQSRCRKGGKRIDRGGVAPR